MASRAFIGAGDLYISRYVSGAFADWQGPYECDKFEIKPNVDLKEKVSKGKVTYGQVIESVTIPQPADLSISLGEVNKESLAIALLGTTAALTQAGGSINNEAVTIKHDVWLPLSKAALQDATVNVTNVAGSTTYAKGIDYLINSTLGWIKFLSTGTTTVGQVAHVDATYDAISGTEIRGMTDPTLRARFRLDGKNFADNLPCIVSVHEAVIAADSAFDFLADDFNSVALPGRMKTPAGYNEPFTVQLRNAAS